MKNFIKLFILFLIGGLMYSLIEIIFRGYTHPSMFVLGGIMFAEIGLINEIFKRNTGLLFQGIAGAVIITVSEFISGLILNIWLGLNVWDYSGMPLNLLGQISLPYSVMWIFLAMGAVIVDDLLRHWLFDEKMPKYRFFQKTLDKK
ncbi:MAG: hypothetical protein IJ460_07495 [Clostridia bacterium]|nr:hypothetical protein [Clostridia bacterium]